MLKVEPSCEIADLIDEVAQRLGKTFDQVEHQALEEHLYPEHKKVYKDLRWPEKDESKWFRKEVEKIMQEQGLQGLYITDSI